MYKSLVFLVSFLTITGLHLCSQDNAPFKSLTSLQQHCEMHGLQLGVAVQELKSQEMIVKHESAFPLIPASTIKILPAIYMLIEKGKDFKYRTPIHYSGEILRDGNLTGDIWIKGSGDPSLANPEDLSGVRLEQFFESLAMRISKAGIKCIDGDLVVDISSYNSNPVPPSWPWEDIGNYYGAGAWALNFHENYYELELERSATEGSPVIPRRILPDIPGMKFKSFVTTAGKYSGDQAYIFGGPYNYYRQIYGTIPVGKNRFTIKGSLPDPPFLFGYYLAEALKDLNIDFRDIVVLNTSPNIKESNPITSMVSKPLNELVQKNLYKSINLYSEAFLLEIGKGDRPEGIRILENYFEINKNPSNKLVDGSGLSPSNRISALDLNSVLIKGQAMLGSTVLLEILPLAGQDGTVKNFMKNSVSKGNAWFKSGSMEGVLCYTGLIRNASGEFLVCSILVNGNISSKSELKSLIESFMDSIYQYGT